MLPKTTIGVRGAVVERARRRGYAQAVKDALHAIQGRVRPRLIHSFHDWQSRVADWRKLANVAAEPNINGEPAPRLNLSRRPESE